jgi:tetratricopeptide (TPR) repeat protein
VSAAIAALAASLLLSRGAGQDAPPAAVRFDSAAVRRAVRQLRAGRDVERNVAFLRESVEQARDPGLFARDVGVLLLEEDLYPEAQGFLEIARERLPQDGLVAQQLGNAHVMQFHYAEAETQLLAAEQLLPPGPHPFLHEYLSMVEIGLQKREASLAHARRAIEEARAWNAAQPAGAPRLDEADFHLNLAHVHQKFLELDDALKVLEAMDEERLGAAARPKWWLARAELLDAKGDDARALAAFARHHELAPDHANGACEYALFQLRHGRTGDARELFELAVRLDPDHEAATFNLARVLLRAGEKEAGRRTMARFEAIRAARVAEEVAFAELRNRLLARAAR